MTFSSPSLLGPVPDALIEEFEVAFLAQQQTTLRTWRLAASMWNAAAARDRDFVADELALLMNVHPRTAEGLMAEALLASGLPSLLMAWEAGELTDRHVRAASDELHRCLDDDADRIAVLDQVLAKCRARGGWPTPGALRRMLRAAALTYDPAAARRREKNKVDDRGTHTYPLPDGQAGFALQGPAATVIAVADAVHARALAMSRLPGEERTLAQLEFDLTAELLTTGTLAGGTAPSVEVQVVMPWETATGQGQGLGELVGYGPISPDTCRDLLAVATILRRVLVDSTTGVVVDVDDPIRVRRATADATTQTVRRDATDAAADLQRLRTAPVIKRDLSTSAYRPTRRATRFVKTRDRTCRFPGCTNPATGTDLDHCRPWPHGPTHPDNLHCLCRHHHRAKQSGRFTVTRNKHGTTTWTTRTGRVYTRPPTPLTPPSA